MSETMADLMRTEGRAELIGGRVVSLPLLGQFPGTLTGRIARRLADHAEAIGVGEVFTTTLVYAVPRLSSGRESFSPNASYYTGPRPANPMSYVPGPPDFAVEVRGENDYGPAAERAMADKRADYFEAGTLVVWDVDPEAGTVARYRPGEPSPTLFRAGDEADAEPAVPGWRVHVDWLMR